jgi:hypothetical protein
MSAPDAPSRSSDSLICGTDSPVRSDSLTTHSPRSSTMSHGTVCAAEVGRGNETMSPGRSASLNEGNENKTKANDGY